jgi:hypothetical protein
MHVSMAEIRLAGIQLTYGRHLECDDGANGVAQRERVSRMVGR